ncbi:winged helix-turn-helix domain-containing protein [Deinococcus yavapaiensis]|uniref:winged helix-turn-helix domain-containing protein n=1 Tax=Deinococcus yavapaiensis TaxID=309889 RepID=UPI001476522D|nr:winged helix-turn-helix domain-containing protein [Deinococcus yavapaiensis]
MTRPQLEERRLAAVPMLEARRPLPEIAAELGVHRHTVEKWSMKYNHGGPDALKRTVSSGRPPRLTPEQEQQLLDALALGCAHHGFPAEQWTMKRVCVVVERLFGVKYHVDGLRPKMRALGLTPQKPTKRAIERDDEQIETFAKETLPEIKKSRS